MNEFWNAFKIVFDNHHDHAKDNGCVMTVSDEIVKYEFQMCLESREKRQSDKSQIHRQPLEFRGIDSSHGLKIRWTKTTA